MLIFATLVFISYAPFNMQACQGQHSRLAAPPRSTPGPTAGKAHQNIFLTRSAQRRAAGGDQLGTGHANARAAEQDEPQPPVESKFEHAFNSVIGSASPDPSTASVGVMEVLAQYCEMQSEKEPPLLSRLREETLTHYAGSPGATRMLCDPLQGRLLALLSTLSGARLVLELGAFTGYSALCLATGLPGDSARGERKVVSCEPDAVARSIALKYIAQAGLQDTVDLRDAKGMSVIEAVRADPAQPLFDLVFLDADKKQYKQYVLALMGSAADGSRSLLRDGALILVDNTLWKGLVLDVGKVGETCSGQQGVTRRMRVLAESVHQFNTFVADEPRLQQLMLPIRDGLSIIRYSGPQPIVN